jgi:transglutaminase-like putative cysteine protease
MCRAVDVRVRFITGLGFTGSAWGDHAWNQIYDPKYDGWVNVDTTFGSSGINYFGRTGFELDHKNAVVQGEWP